MQANNIIYISIAKTGVVIDPNHRGVALAKHADLTKEVGMPVYFCDPRSHGTAAKCFIKPLHLRFYCKRYGGKQFGSSRR